MKKIILVLSLCLTALFLIGCAEEMSDDEAADALEELSDEELAEATVAEDEDAALAGEAVGKFSKGTSAIPLAKQKATCTTTDEKITYTYSNGRVVNRDRNVCFARNTRMLTYNCPPERNQIERCELGCERGASECNTPEHFCYYLDSEGNRDPSRVGLDYYGIETEEGQFPRQSSCVADDLSRTIIPRCGTDTGTSISWRSGEGVERGEDRVYSRECGVGCGSETGQCCRILEGGSTLDCVGGVIINTSYTQCSPDPVLIETETECSAELNCETDPSFHEDYCVDYLRVSRNCTGAIGSEFVRSAVDCSTHGRGVDGEPLTCVTHYSGSTHCDSSCTPGETIFTCNTVSGNVRQRVCPESGFGYTFGGAVDGCPAGTTCTPFSGTPNGICS